MNPTANNGFSVVPVSGVPMVRPGDNLSDLILQALDANQLSLQDGDIVCLAQKIVSKAEGQLVALAGVTPSERAKTLADETDKDPRLVELILQESSEVMRQRPGVLIVRHRLGLVGAHAGIDQSNVDHSGGEQALLLPAEPDKSAAHLCSELSKRSKKRLGVLITDSQNRPWRMGTTGCAIGCAGFTVLDDHRGGQDLYGRELRVTLINRADSIAAAATLVMGETTEKIPLALVRGLAPESVEKTQHHNAAMINRPVQEDLFR
ncbi:MAG: coenzyme F420-0:L-glutamate ligase [Pseudomonadales bacterium]|jgi:coenzyme F420-0:L-glutamate ligase/coenzyme F420-1:gamma-L-glutamate ligase|nr:coenzyme F420-0:L-glutamate ligase [Pseudomonadales bacterium]